MKPPPARHAATYNLVELVRQRADRMVELARYVIETGPMWDREVTEPADPVLLQCLNGLGILQHVMRPTDDPAESWWQSAREYPRSPDPGEVAT